MSNKWKLPAWAEPGYLSWRKDAELRACARGVEAAEGKVISMWATPNFAGRSLYVHFWRVPANAISEGITMRDFGEYPMYTRYKLSNDAPVFTRREDPMGPLDYTETVYTLETLSFTLLLPDWPIKYRHLRQIEDQSRDYASSGGWRVPDRPTPAPPL